MYCFWNRENSLERQTYCEYETQNQSVKPGKPKDCGEYILVYTQVDKEKKAIFCVV